MTRITAKAGTRSGGKVAATTGKGEAISRAGKAIVRAGKKEAIAIALTCPVSASMDVVKSSPPIATSNVNVALPHTSTGIKSTAVLLPFLVLFGSRFLGVGSHHIVSVSSTLEVDIQPQDGASTYIVMENLIDDDKTRIPINFLLNEQAIEDGEPARKHAQPMQHATHDTQSASVSQQDQSLPDIHPQQEISTGYRQMDDASHQQPQPPPRSEHGSRYLQNVCPPPQQMSRHTFAPDAIVGIPSWIALRTYIPTYPDQVAKSNIDFVASGLLQGVGSTACTVLIE
ncbi:hypothetical protein CORC01_10348 [Colletotrichum orchidophilum]|uniref:Uncharacterized protein n=1 Tax=Colletotrichum orchidophilum TaxID=1209926 RepID=A0A1G4AYT8_9PEZI|nr:uncharacterized protein CORC01_10348 [Colletotrichum orchidophilum]OHE94301.1 hypothetical protein CORC01_10348 [Colletotrichum orchidophilum]